MNKSYRVIWNKVRNCYVVASELVGSGRHNAGRKRKGAVMFSMAAFLAFSWTIPVIEAAESYTIRVDEKGNVVSAETLSSGTEKQSVQNSIAGGVYSISIGKGAETKGDYAVAIGTGNVAGGTGSFVFGKNNLAIGDYSLAYGMDSRASGENATAFGYHAAANGKNSTAWGDHTTADYKIEYFSNGTTAYIKNSGGKNVYVNQNGIKLLMDAKGEPFTYHFQPILVGQDGNGYVEKYVRGKGYQKFKVTVNANGSLSIATTPAEGDITYQTVEGDFETVENNTAFGKDTVSSGNQATAWGDANVAAGENATAWGEDNVASGENATAWGEDTVASGWNATAWGMDSVASGESTTAWGEYSIAAGVRATAWGDESEAYGEDSTAFGDNSIAGGDNSLAALGGKTGVEDDDGYIDGRNSAAIGMNAWAKVDDSIALGSRSVADREAGQGADYQEHSGFDAMTGKESTKTDSVWRSTESAIAVGNPEDNVTRQIIGVAAGYEDTDAVNVAQLKEVRKMAGAQAIVESGSDNISVQDSTNPDGNKIYTVDLSKDITLGKGVDGDKTVTVNGIEGTITAGTGDDQVTVDGSRGQVVVGGNNGVKIGKIEDGDNSLAIYDKDGNKTERKDNGGKYATNLDNKTWDKEGSYVSGRAATEDQLHQVESNVNMQMNNVNEKIDKVTKQHTTVSVNENAEKGNLVLTKTDATDTAGANYDISLSNDVTIGSTGASGKDGRMTIASQDGTKSIIAEGKNGTLIFQDGPYETAVQAGAATKGVDGAAEIKRITADGHTVATMDDGMKYGGDSGSAAVKLNNNVQIYGGAAEYADGNNIGVIASQDGDNAKLQVKLAKDLKGINSMEANTITTGNTTINNGGLTVKAGDSGHQDITIQQGNVNMGGNQVEGVAPGEVSKDSTDAVNGSQLWQRDQAIHGLNGSVNELGNRINRVGAGAAALAALHPLDFDPDDKWDFAAGYGNYRGANAAAVGAYYRPNEDTMFSVGGSFGGGENMVNAGVSWKFGQGNHVSTSRVAMAKELKAMRQHIAEQDALIARLQRMHGMAVDSAKDTLFPDVAENHWAYQYVTKLGRQGILDGYPDGEFKGNRMMTRYEFAAIVYRLVESGAGSTDPELSKLVKEFSPELQYIRLDTIRKDRSGIPTIERVRVLSNTK